MTVLTEDIQAALDDPVIAWEAFRGATVLVTGATGAIGGRLARTLHAAGASRDLGLTLVVQGRDRVRGGALEHELGATFLAGDVRDLSAGRGGLERLDYVFHGAGVTASVQMVAAPAEVLSTAVEGTRAVLELAAGCGAAGVVCLSSMEVYGHGLTGVIGENRLGILDPGDPRSSYPEGKRRAEALATAYAVQHGLRTVNARLGLTFGAGIPDDPANTRVALQFARAVRQRRNIVLHTDGGGVTNVCDLGDAVRALLLLATDGAPGEAYNVANPAASMTIRAMAELVAREVAGGTIDVIVDPPADLAARGYAPPGTFVLSVDKLRALGWEPRRNMAELYERMLAGWRL